MRSLVGHVYRSRSRVAKTVVPDCQQKKGRSRNENGSSLWWRVQGNVSWKGSLFTPEASRYTAGNQSGNNELRACKQYPTPCLQARTTIPTIHLSLHRLNSRSSLNLLTWVVSSDFFPTFFWPKQLGKLWINVFFYNRFQNKIKSLFGKIKFVKFSISQNWKRKEKENPSLWFLMSEGTFDPRFNFLMEPLF